MYQDVAVTYHPCLSGKGTIYETNKVVYSYSVQRNKPFCFITIKLNVSSLIILIFLLCIIIRINVRDAQFRKIGHGWIHPLKYYPPQILNIHPPLKY